MMWVTFAVSVVRSPPMTRWSKIYSLSWLYKSFEETMSFSLETGAFLQVFKGTRQLMEFSVFHLTYLLCWSLCGVNLASCLQTKGDA